MGSSPVDVGAGLSSHYGTMTGDGPRGPEDRCDGRCHMIPKPPFACDLSLEDELAAFERLKPRLAEIWSALTASDDRSYTSVVVPSMTLDQSELRKLVGAPFYEERLLLLLIRLRNPKAHVVYVTSQPVHPLILDYYLGLLIGVPASHARRRPDDAVRASIRRRVHSRRRSSNGRAWWSASGARSSIPRRPT